MIVPLFGGIMRTRRYSTDPEKREKYLEYFKRKHKENYYDKDKSEYRKLFYSEPINRLHSKLVSIKSLCKKKNIPYDLSIHDIVIPEYCPLLNIKLTCTVGEGRLDSTMSLDRINPELGYVKGNVRIISDLANRMKNSATEEQLKTFAINILKELS